MSWVINKTSQEYEGGPGYSGHTCGWTGLEPGKIYENKEDAQTDANTLADRNRGAKFKVIPYKKIKKSKEKE